MDKRDPVARRRTFAIISHPDAGKTTLTEKLLLFGGAIQLAGEVRAKANRRQTRSDWMSIERERGISVVTSVMTFEYGGCVYQSARHAGPRRLFGRHLSHADGGRFRGHGDRRRQGHRGAHAQAVRSVPAARHSDHHLHQQDGPRDAAIPSTCSTRSRRRWRSTPRRSPGRSAAAAISSAPTICAQRWCGVLDGDAERDGRSRGPDDRRNRGDELPTSTRDIARARSTWCVRPASGSTARRFPRAT